MTERKQGRIALAGSRGAGGASATPQFKHLDSPAGGQIGREVLRILVLEDRDADAELIERALRKAGFAYTFERARDEAAFLARLDPAPQVIVADYYVPGCDALHALKLVRSRGLDVPFILVSGVIGETRALEAMRLGATDFLLKDRLGRLGSAIRTALELAALRRKANGVRAKPERTGIDARDGQLARADRARKVMADCSHALVHAGDERQLLQEMCRIVVDSGGYVQSYIGLAQDDDDKSVAPVASAGFEEGYLDQAQRSWRADVRRPSVMGDVIASGERFLTRDIFADPKLARWAERARSRGYQSLICLPLTIEERCVGGVSIYAREADAFDRDEIALLEMLAEDISYGIAALRARAALRESEERFRDFTELGSDWSWEQDEKLRFVLLSKTVSSHAGIAASEHYGRTRWELPGTEPVNTTWEEHRAQLQARQPFRNLLLKRTLKNGQVRYLSSSGKPRFDAGGRFQGYRGVASDVTEKIVAERAIAEQEGHSRAMFEHYRVMFENAAVGITRVDLNGVLVDVNQKFCDMLGYTREELKGKAIRDVTHPDDGSGFRALLAQGVQRSASGEKRFVRKDGAIIWARRTMSTGLDARGKPQYVISVVEDITERKAAEEALRVSEETFRVTFDQASVGIIVTDLDHRYLQVNGRYCEIVGYSREDLMRMTVFDVNLPENVVEALAFRHKLISGEAQPALLEKQLRRRDGTLVWVTLVTSLVRGKNGDPMHFISVIQDITDSKQAQERYRSTFDNAPVGIMHTSIRDDRVVHANSRLCEMLGYAYDDLVKMKTDDLIHPSYVGADQPKYRERMLKGELETFSSERLYQRRDGSDLWVTRTVSLARDTAGRPLYFIRMLQDISERKRAEEAVARERALLRTIIDTVPDYIYVKDAQGHFQLANKAWLKERGIDDEQILGKTVFDVFSPAEVARRMADQDAAVVETGIPMLGREQQVTVKTPDGKPGRSQWAAITKVPMRDAAGQIIGTVGISRNITEQKLSERRREMEHSVTLVLAESGTLVEAMRRILRNICEGLELACGSYWQWDEATELLRCTESWHIDAAGVAEFAAASRDGSNEAPAWRGGLPPRSSTGGLVRSVWQSGAPVWFPDVTQRPDFRRGPAAAKASLHCAFGFPVLAGGHPLGVMEFYGRDIKEPDEALLQIVRAIGSQIGQFIQRKEAEQALRLNEERYRHQFEASPLPMWVWDDEGLKFLAVNQAAVDHYGYTREEFLRMSVRDVWAPNEEQGYDENIRKRAGEQTLNLQRRHRVKDGRIIDVEVTARRFMREGRDVWLTLVNDISERLRAERALQESEEQFRQLANNIPQVFWITDVRQKETLYVSPAAEALIGFPLEKIRAHPRILVRSIHHEDRPRVYGARKGATAGGYDETYRIVRPDGTIRWVHDRAFPVPDAAGKVYRIAGIAEDITERKLAEERLMHLAHYDVLTSLPNRVLYYDRLRQALAHAKRNQWTVGVMLIDVDRFKNVNDTLGHAVGDLLLQQVSERLIRSVRAGDTVGRLGGDEFAVVLSNLATAQDANLVAQKIMGSFKDPFRLAEGGEIYVTASIGITLYPDDSTDQDALIKNADAAMYRAKAVGRNAYRFYTPEMNARALELLSMESSLRRALDRREFLLHYQPKVSVATGEIVGVEALLRWRHPERGLVSPGDFMPVLEETGLIVPVGEWVVKAVCAQISVWQSAGIDPKVVAINLSARQFGEKDLGGTIKRILDENGIDPQLIEFEITESSLMANTEESIRTLEFLGQLGVGLSIDDFGTGYSSLGYLKRFPLDALKIDRSFVRDITTSADDATITRAVISMAHSLGLKVIAEGVETEEQISFLAEHGCDEFQGFYFSRPLPSDECGVWIKDKRALLRRPQPGGPGAPIVLLVDDDNDSLTLFKRALAKDSYQVLTAHSAHEGLELLGKHRVDLVISDQNMPGIPGIEFLRRVKAQFPNATRMMTSAHSGLGDTAEAAELFRFLPKQLSEEEVRAGVREALGRNLG